MEPGIHYAKTSDGVSIAYAVLGGGPAAMYTTSPLGISTGIRPVYLRRERLRRRGECRGAD